MLKMYDKTGKLKFIWFDADSEPTSVEELSSEELKILEKEKERQQDVD